MTIPGWFFDELANHRQDMDDFEQRLGAWDALLEGGEYATVDASDWGELVRAMTFASMGGNRSGRRHGPG
jgi:hypothetical protein